MGYYGMTMSTIQISRRSSSSKLEGFEKRLQTLYRKSSLRRFAEHVQDDEEISGLLEDLQEAINDYQVRSRFWHHSRC